MNPPGTLWNVVLVLAGVAALWYGALVLVENSVYLAHHYGVSPGIVGVLVVGIGTSMPEVAVTVDAALQGAPDLAVANVVGSNFFNLGIVLGAVALVRAVPVRGPIVRRDGLVVLASTVLTLVFLRDLRLTPVEGGVLLVGLVVYLIDLLRRSGGEGERTGAAADTDPEVTAPTPPDVEDPPGLALPALGKAVLGLGLVVLGADVLVRGASALALAAGISEWVVGLTVVAAGTSTPEFAASVVAAVRGEHDLSVGNLVGSSAFNLLAVLGVAGLAGPLSVAPSALGGLVWLLGLVVLALVLLRSGRELTRIEGGLLVLVALSRWAVDLLGLPVP